MSDKSSTASDVEEVNQLIGSASGLNESRHSAAAAADDIDSAIETEIEKIVRANTRSRKPTVTKQVVKVPGPAGKVKTVVRRLATPVPDIIERIVVIEPSQDIVNVVIERPTTPPPQVQEKKVIEKALKPHVSHQIVRVQSRSAKSTSRKEYATASSYNQVEYNNNSSYAQQAPQQAPPQMLPPPMPQAPMQSYQYTDFTQQYAPQQDPLAQYANYGNVGYAQQPRYAQQNQMSYAQPQQQQQARYGGNQGSLSGYYY